MYFERLYNELENIYGDLPGSEDGLIVPVDPSDLKNVWKKQRELAAAVGGQSIVIDRGMFSDVARRGQT